MLIVYSPHAKHDGTSKCLFRNSNIRGTFYDSAELQVEPVLQQTPSLFLFWFFYFRFAHKPGFTRFSSAEEIFAFNSESLGIAVRQTG